MPKEDKKILKYNYGEKSLKLPFVIYADLECLLEKNDPEKTSIEKNTHVKMILKIFYRKKTLMSK